jgi:hypothetical protein
MTYGTLQAIRLAAWTIVGLIVMILYFIMLFSCPKIMSSSYPYISIFPFFLVDGLTIKLFKKDLLDKKHEGETGYYAFRFFYFIDFLIGIPLAIAAIISVIYTILH